MIYYRVLSRIIEDKRLLYYLTTDSFKFKESFCALNYYEVDWIVYKDFYSSYPKKGLDILNESGFHVLDYKEVETLYTLVHGVYIKSGVWVQATGLLKDLERTLVYWDDFN